MCIFFFSHLDALLVLLVIDASLWYKPGYKVSRQSVGHLGLDNKQSIVLGVPKAIKVIFLGILSPKSTMHDAKF